MNTDFIGRWCMLIGCLTMALGPGAAVAQSDLEASVVFFELYIRGSEAGAKTPEYVTGLEGRIGELKTYSILSRQDAARSTRGTMGTPARRVAASKLKQIEELLAQGNDLAFTQPEKAIEVLQKAKSQLKALHESITGNAKLRSDLFKTQMLLARSHLFGGNQTKAKQIMSEIVRTFEDDYPVTNDTYHPRVVDLYKSIFAEMQSQKTGTLEVRTNPPACDVYINGRPMKQKSPYTYRGLYPGTLRVTVAKGNLQSMVRRIEVPANGKGTVDVDLAYEAALTFTDSQFGLTFDGEAGMKKNLINYSVKLGKQLKVDYVVLAGVVERDGKPMLAAWQVDVKSRSIIRERALTVKANVVSNRRIQEMSDYIADVKTPTAPQRRIQPWYKNWIGWTLVGAGVALGGAAGGVGAEYWRHRGNAEDPNYLATFGRDAAVDAANKAKDLEMPGILLGSLAGASIVAGIVVFAVMEIEEDEPEDASLRFGRDILASPVLLPGGGGGVSATLRF